MSRWHRTSAACCRTTSCVNGRQVHRTLNPGSRAVGPRRGAGDRCPRAARLPWLLQNYRVITAQDALLGRKATRLELAPVAHDRPTHRLTVDDETGVVLRSERAGPDGSLGEVTAFLKFEIMPVGWRRGA